MSNVNCFLCQTSLEIRTSKREKPYLVCDDCGVQTFFRLPKGIRRLKQRLNDPTALTDNFIFCRECRVAVEKCAETLKERFLSKSGFYCPKCEELLLEMSEEELERQ